MEVGRWCSSLLIASRCASADLQQALNFGGDFGLKMVLQHGALVGSQQFAALGDLFGKARGEAIRAFGPVLVDDVDDEAPVALFGMRLVAERAEGALQFRQVFADLPLQARPGLVVVLEFGQGLFGAAGQRQRRIDRPRDCPCQAGRPAAAQPRAGRWPRSAGTSRLLRRARRCVVRNVALAVAACSCAIARASPDLLRTSRASVQRGIVCASTAVPRIGQPPLQLLDLGADGSAQHVEPDGGFFRLNAGGRKLFVLLLQIVAGFVLAAALPLHLGQRKTHLVSSVGEAELGIVIAVQRRLDGRQLGR